jgi:hypothetical protein
LFAVIEVASVLNVLLLDVAAGLLLLLLLVLAVADVDCCSEEDGNALAAVVGGGRIDAFVTRGDTDVDGGMESRAGELNKDWLLLLLPEVVADVATPFTSDEDEIEEEGRGRLETLDEPAS